MNKEQSADDPSRGSDSCKKCLIAPTFSPVTLDVVIACIEHKVSLKHSRAIEAALVSTL